MTDREDKFWRAFLSGWTTGVIVTGVVLGLLDMLRSK